MSARSAAAAGRRWTETPGFALVVAVAFTPALTGAGACSEASVHGPSSPGSGGGGSGSGGSSGGGGAGGVDPWAGLTGPDASTGAEGGPPAEPAGPAMDVVYAHSGSDLFRVDPESMDVTRVGNFVILEASGTTRFLNSVTDIAVDRARRIVGLTYNQVLQIDAATAECRVLAPLPQGESFNGLSWIRTDSGPERLLATSHDGGVYQIDPATGVATHLGELGGGLRSSGDLVSVASYGTLLTIQGGATGDQLARVDPVTGTATVIGDTGFRQIWGLGFWKSQVFGFTQAGEFLLIDPRTARSTLVRRFTAFPFWGAGVTTAVKVVVVE